MRLSCSSSTLALVAALLTLAVDVQAAGAATRTIPRTVPTWADLADEDIRGFWQAIIVQEDGGTAVATPTASLPSWAASDADRLAVTDASGTGKWVRATTEGYATNLTIFNGWIDSIVATNLSAVSALVFPGKGYDIREFGAVADDSTNDFDEIQDCVQAAEGAGVRVELGPGTYNLTSSSQFLQPTNSLHVIGHGPSSILHHNGLATETVFFKLSTATNLVLENLTLENARYCVYVPTNVPADLSITLRNVTIRECKRGVHCSRTIDGTETLARGVLFDNVLFQGSTTETSAGIWWRNVPTQIVAVRNSRFEGGQYGVDVALDNVSTNYNPATINPRVLITGSYFTGQESATSGHQAIEVLAYSPYISGNTFTLGATQASSDSSAAAIYAYAGSGFIGYNLFDRWGNATDKPNTIVLKGQNLQGDPFDISTLSGAYNHPAGWGVLLQGNRFVDERGTNNVGCGKILLDVDGVTFRQNVFEGFDDQTLITATPSTSNTDDGYISILDNWFIRCSWTELLGLNYDNQLVRNLRIEDNRFLWINPNTDNPTTNPYCLVCYTPSVDIRVNNNHFWYCYKAIGLRMALASDEYANNIQCIGNYAVCDPTDVMSRFFYGPTAGSLTNVVIRDNYADYVNRPVDLNTGATYVGLEVSGNVANSYGSGNSVPYGTPSGSAHRVFGNLNNGTLDFVDAQFRGVTTTTPTKFINAGSTFLSNNVFYIYTGSAWVAP